MYHGLSKKELELVMLFGSLAILGALHGIYLFVAPWCAVIFCYFLDVYIIKNHLK